MIPYGKKIGASIGAAALYTFLNLVNPSDAIAQEKEYNILADELKSKEVLVNWDKNKDRAYIGTGIPVMTAQDTLNLSDKVKGKYELVAYDFPKGVIVKDNKIITSRDVEDGIINGALIYRDPSTKKITESVRLIVPVFTGVDPEKLSELERKVTILKGKITEEEIARQRVEEEKESYKELFERARDTAKEYMDITDEQKSVIEKKSEELKKWTVGPYLGINNDKSIEGGLNATIGSVFGKKNIMLGFLYKSPLEKDLGETFEEVRNEVPNDTGRPINRLGTDVRQTTTERTSEIYSLEGLLGLQISDRITPFITTGIDRAANTKRIQDYMFREREGIDGNIIKINETLNEPKVFDSVENHLKIGGGAIFKINEHIGLKIRGVYTPRTKGFNASGGVQINLRALKGKNKR